MFGTKELKITKERYYNTLNLYNDVMDIIVNKSQFLYNMKKNTEKYLPTYSTFIDQFKVKPSNINEEYQESLKNIDKYHEKQQEYNTINNDNSNKSLYKNGYFRIAGATTAYASLFGKYSLNTLNIASSALVYNPIYDILYLSNPLLAWLYIYKLKKYNSKEIENFNKACAQLKTIIIQHKLKMFEIDKIINTIQELLHNLNMYFLKLADCPKCYNALSLEQQNELGVFVNLYKTLSVSLIQEIKLT